MILRFNISASFLVVIFFYIYFASGAASKSFLRHVMTRYDTLRQDGKNRYNWTLTPNLKIWKFGTTLYDSQKNKIWQRMAYPKARKLHHGEVQSFKK